MRMGSLLAKSIASGTVAGLAVLGAVALRGQATIRNPVAPINATSHVLWGDDAASMADSVSLKYTLPGVLINHASAIFWAILYEAMFWRDAETGRASRALAGGMLVAGLAYLTDYLLVPKRLTPGWELRLDQRQSLPAIYATLALSLPWRGLLRSRRENRRAWLR